MIKEMNKDIFSQYLDMTINEIKQKEGIQLTIDVFLINAVVEEGKVLTAKDEVMRLNILNKDRIDKHIYTKEEVVSMLTFFCPLVPVWIDVQYISNQESKSVFELKCSLRLRKPSLLRNQDLGHPPFRAILREDL